LANRYFAKREKELFEGTEPKPVLIAARDIPSDTTITERDVKAVKIPAKFIQPSAISSKKAVIGKLTITPILKGEQILSTKIVSPEKGGWLAIKTPVGKRAVSISADSVSAVSGLIKPGDYVDILATFDLIKIGEGGRQEVQSITLPLFQNVLVLAVDREMKKVFLPEDKKQGRRERREISTITLALSPEEAENLVFAEEKGKIRLMLRGVKDNKESPLGVVNFSTLLQNFSPILPLKVEEKERERKKEIEVFRGLEKEGVTK